MDGKKQAQKTREEHERAKPGTLNQEQTEEEEEEDMFKDYQSYQQMIARGRRITAIIRKGPICEGSLSCVRKQALDLYRKEMSLQDFSQ